MPSAYKIILNTDLLLLIVGQGPQSQSLTNSAALVISDLNTSLQGLGRRRVFYRDSINRFDEIRHENGVFSGFAPCAPSQQSYFADICSSAQT